jgi:hypothetical protein
LHGIVVSLIARCRDVPDVREGGRDTIKPQVFSPSLSHTLTYPRFLLIPPLPWWRMPAGIAGGLPSCACRNHRPSRPPVAQFPPTQRLGAAALMPGKPVILPDTNGLARAAVSSAASSRSAATRGHSGSAQKNCLPRNFLTVGANFGLARCTLVEESVLRRRCISALPRPPRTFPHACECGVALNDCDCGWSASRNRRARPLPGDHQEVLRCHSWI